MKIRSDESIGNFSFINQILHQLDFKPNRKTIEYANNFIESTGGYQKYYEAFQKHHDQTISINQDKLKL